MFQTCVTQCIAWTARIMKAQERDDLLEERRQTMAKLKQLEEKVYIQLFTVMTNDSCGMKFIGSKNAMPTS